jgi:diguanylate cyclase (GGDEF)-like protein
MTSSVGLAGSPRLMLAIASSYLLDASLLAAFAMAGTIAPGVAGWYLGAGIGECLLYALLHHRLLALAGFEAHRGVLLRIAAGAVLQLAFAAAVPQVGFYFLLVLLIVMGLGSMIASTREASCIWFAISVLGGALFFLPGAPFEYDSLVPLNTAQERLLVWVGLMLVLGRCILIGIFSRSLRLRLHRHDAQLRQSVAVLQARDESFERMNAELHHQANHDALTGLANRALFGERLRRASLSDEPFAVVMLDLDRFKVINDSLGHGAGDDLLKHVASRLQNSTRASDLVARSGGDEFMVLLADVDNRDRIEELAARWMAALSEPYSVRGMELHVSPSIGIALFPADATDCEELVAFADEAMYYAKQSGRNTVRFYDPNVVGFARGRLTLESELRLALAASQFELLYQPKADVANNSIRSVEAILRWQHPTRGAVAAAEFLPVADDSGLSHAISVWVLDTACRQARRWAMQDGPALRVGVNVSATQFRHPEFARLIEQTLSRHALEPACIEIEIDESALMGDAERSQATLTQLSRIGVVVAIDHFGTGYSNIGYLRRFPIDKIKIDAGFVRDLESNPNDASIVHAIVSLAHGLRLKVVAEGVETESQLATLKRMGCDQYQGTLRCAPAPAAEIEALIASDRVAQPASTTVLNRTISKLARLVHSAYWLTGPSIR